MLNMSDLKEIASMSVKKGYFVSLYLNVDPMFNKKGDFMVHFKNMMKSKIATLDKAVYKKVKADLEKIDNYVLANKRMFKKGLALLSSSDNTFWKEYHLGVPVKNDLIVDKSPYTNPLLEILDNYQRCAVLIVSKESARIFVMHLGEVVEYGEVHSKDIPGKHKKGGWFALSQNHYERHIDYHVGLHLKDVIGKLGSFLGGERIERLVIGGSDEAVSLVKSMLHRTVLERVIGHVKVEMFARPDEVLNKVQAVLLAYEKKIWLEMVETLVAKALKNENAVLGLDNVLNALQTERVMRLVVLEGYKASGFVCSSCGYLSAGKIAPCPFCKGEMETADNIVELAAGLAVQQSAHVGIIPDNKPLSDAGGIGAFLRY